MTWTSSQDAISSFIKLHGTEKHIVIISSCNIGMTWMRSRGKAKLFILQLYQNLKKKKLSMKFKTCIFVTRSIRLYHDKSQILFKKLLILYLKKCTKVEILF